MALSPMQKLFTENEPNSDVIREQACQFGADYLGGEWKNVKKEQVKIQQFTNGQSNFLFHVTSPSATPFLIRIHRQHIGHVFVDTVNFAIFSERGLGPKLYGFFDGGRLEEYLPSKTMDSDDVLDSEISRRIGAAYPKYHAVPMPISKNRRAISLMREWLDAYKNLGGGDYPIKKTTITSYLEHPETVSIENLARELDTFEKWASVFEDTVVYSHNDLACGNILELESTKEIIFIDFEFSSYNWRGFDLGMHLAETAIDYRVPFPPGVKFIEELTDNPPNLEIFCEAYVDSDNKLKNRIPSDRSSEISHLVDECLFFWPLTHLFWAIWSMEKSLQKFDNGVDLDVAAGDRLAVYFHLRNRSQKIYEKYNKQYDSVLP